MTVNFFKFNLIDEKQELFIESKNFTDLSIVRLDDESNLNISKKMLLPWENSKQKSNLV